MNIHNILTGSIAPRIFFAPPDDGAGGDKPGPKAEQVHVGKEAREFGKRFAAKPEHYVAQGTVPPSESRKPAEGEGAPPADDASRQREQERERKGPGSNVPKIIEDKKAAEAAAAKATTEAAEAKARLETYEKETVPKLETKINELQAQIDSGKLSPATEERYTKQIAEIEKKKDAEAASIREELTKTQKRLEVYNLAESREYKEKFVRPLGQAIEQLNSIAGNNVVLQKQISRAMMAHRAALGATSNEERAQMEEERDSAMSSVLDGMNTMQQRRVTTAFESFMERSEAQALALVEHEATAEILKKESAERFKEGLEKTVAEWTSEYSMAAKEFPDIELPDDVKSKIEELGIKIDIDADEDLSKKAVRGELKKQSVVRLLHQARLQPRTSAALKASLAIIEGLRETIQKLQGSDPGSGSRDSRPPVHTPAGVKVNEEGQDRTAWTRKFRPPTSR